MDPAQQWESRRGLDQQVFVMTTDGGLNRWEVMQMTNVQRKAWIQMITAKAKMQKEAHEKARSGSSGPKTLGN